MSSANENGREGQSDEALAISLQQGNEEAFDMLVRRYQGNVYAIAFRVTGNYEDACDITQEVFIKVYRKINSWRPRYRFKSWLIRLVINQAIDTLRKTRRRKQVALEDVFGPENNMPGPDRPAYQADRYAEAEETGRRIHQALSALSPAQRTVFVLRHYEGMALQEIAGTMNCSVGSVKVHLFRALRKLREELNDLWSSPGEDSGENRGT